MSLVGRAPRRREPSVEEGSTRKVVDWSGSWRAAWSGNRLGWSLVTKVAVGRPSDPAGRNVSEQASKVTMRMPTHRSIGEGCVSGEAIDMWTRLIRRGSGHGTSERWFE